MAQVSVILGCHKIVTVYIFFILPPEFLPVLGPLTEWCASTLDAALLCSSRAGFDVTCLMRDLNSGPLSECLLEFDTRSKQLSHHGWIIVTVYYDYFD